MQDNLLYGSYRTRTFVDIFPNASAFTDELEASPLYISDDMFDLEETFYYLMYARYGNSHIANADENQFKYRVFALCHEYMPTLNKKLAIQKKLRDLDLSSGDLFVGAKMIYNHSFNPSSAPSTSSLEELNTINEQNTAQNKRNKLDAYTFLYEALNDNLWKNFLDRFKKLFLTIVQPDDPLWYVTETV